MVDIVEGKHHKTFVVLFVATLEGTVKKMIQLPGHNETCIIEEIYITPKDKPQPITQLRILSQEVSPSYLKIVFYLCQIIDKVQSHIA